MYTMDRDTVGSCKAVHMNGVDHMNGAEAHDTSQRPLSSLILHVWKSISLYVHENTWMVRTRVRTSFAASWKTITPRVALSGRSTIIFYLDKVGILNNTTTTLQIEDIEVNV